MTRRCHGFALEMSVLKERIGLVADLDRTINGDDFLAALLRMAGRSGEVPSPLRRHQAFGEHGSYPPQRLPGAFFVFDQGEPDVVVAVVP